MDGVRCQVTCRHAHHAALNVSCILETSAAVADTDVLCLINSDILLLPDFAPVVRHVFEDVKFGRALLVGRRTDVSVTDFRIRPIDVSLPLWDERLSKTALSKGKLHAA